MPRTPGERLRRCFACGLELDRDINARSGGFLAGSSLWWLLLSGGVSLVGHRVTAGGLLWINKVSGAVIVVFRIAAIVLSRQG
ncbi:MAG: hypothetical protein AB1576_00275 [Bacillota bacterium]